MLRQHLRRRNGIPGHDTIRRVFEVPEPNEVERRFADWAGHVCPALDGQVIAIDAKSVRGSGSVLRRVKPLPLVSAYATGVGVMLAQQRCEEKSKRTRRSHALNVNRPRGRPMLRPQSALVPAIALPRVKGCYARPGRAGKLTRSP
jgi:hypothetical protein